MKFCHASETKYGHFLCTQLVLTNQTKLLGLQRGGKNLWKNKTSTLSLLAMLILLRLKTRN